MEAEKKLTGYPSIDKPWLKYYSDEAINAPLPECTIYEYLWENNKDHLDDVALIYFGKKITYGELFENIDTIASALIFRGIKEGDTITLCTLTTPETIYCIYAAGKLGVLCNIVEPRVNAESIVMRINETNSKVLIILDVFYNKIKSQKINADITVITSLKQSMGMLTKIGFSLTKERKIPKVTYSKIMISWETFIQAPKANEKATYKKNLPLAVIYTSGTTGIAKGAVLSHYSVNAVPSQCRFPFPHSRGDRFFAIMPPFIAYGLVSGIHVPLSLGLTMVIVPMFVPQKFPDYILKYKPNFFLGVPSYYEYLLNSKKLKSADLSFIKVAGMGGDALNIKFEKMITDFLKSHNTRPIVYKGYGLTEMSGASVAVALSMKGDEYGALGVPYPKNTVSVFEPGTDKELKIGEQGEICVTGPGMMLGYYNNEEETEKILKYHSDGLRWAHTQDLGYVDADGLIYFVDRIKRMIVRPDGHNVFPAQIEAVLLQHPSVEQCCVVGLKNPDSDNGRIPTAFVVLKENARIDSSKTDLDAFSKERLPERDVAMQYHFIDKLPLTPVGKVDYRALEQQAANEQR